MRRAFALFIVTHGARKKIKKIEKTKVQKGNLEILKPTRATVVAAMGHLSFRSFVIEKSLPSQAKVGYVAFEETIEHAAATPVGES